jgi:hypothetical protein
VSDNVEISFETDIHTHIRQNLLFVLRSIQKTQIQCDHNVEFLNVNPGGT